VYIVMELLEGRNFRDVLTQEAPLAPARAVALMLQIASAVEAAHEAGVIHRDLKPGNIFLVEGRNAPPLVKVLDFGIAKLAAEVSDEQETHALTQTGVMIGTPRYMSPEQCEGARLTTSADVYSLGVIFYEMLTGVTPFSGTTPLSVAMQHQSKAPPPPREWVPGLPRELELLTLHTLEKKPEARPSDAGEFRRELTAAAEAIGLTPHGALSGALSTGGWPLVSGVRVETSLSAKNDNVFSVEPLPEEPLVAPRVPALRETTQLLDSFAKLVPSSDNGAQATDDPAVEVAKSWPGAAMTVVAVGETISEAAGRGGITRLRVNIDDKPSLLASHLLRPPVLVAASLVALMCLIGAATFSTKRPRAETVPAMQGSSAEAQPAPPTAETTPTPPAPEVSPTPAAAAAKETKKESANRQRGQRAARGNQQPPKKKDNIFVRGAKKIFRNPF
ncbi:MAG: protein kinase domain-containing protein, partial [Pyrinomonadaceae bacterium]